mmetsp:Transcript_52385/g.101202  ORF Transcript_52385/g.101202 Transcript_52385/m.101202 type:complete len:678 (+) Transcript_52385:62-2095(+)
MPSTAVKEEEEEDVIPNEPVEVPPGVVLDKVEQLLSSGKVLLRYSTTHGKAWGINGKVDNNWCSFKVEIDGTCQLVDDTVWVTETTSEWADSEVEWLEKLRTLALKVPSTQTKQPSALRPRECRKAVFQYHKAEYVKQRQAKAKAKAKSTSIGEHDVSPENGLSAGIVPAVAKFPAKPQGPSIPKVKAALAKTPAFGPAATKQIGSAKPPLTKTPQSKLPPPSLEITAQADRPAAQLPKSSGFSAFLAEVKARLTQNGEREKYRAFLAAVSKGTQREQGIADALAGHDDLLEKYRSLQKPVAKSGKVPADPTSTESGQPEPMADAADADATVAEGADETTADIVALPRTLQTPINVESEVLSKLVKAGGDAAAQLVKLVLSKRLARAGLRLAMLKYARSQTNEDGAFREMIILRGPPGLGKSTWAMEQLRLQVGLSKDEELVARLTHICSADDFFTTFKPDDGFDYSFDLEKLEMAFACNEARVRLAMEAGIHPLYVDNSHLQLWEMAAYARRAREAGYEVSIVAPQDIFFDWESVDDLLARCNGRPRLQTISRELLEEILKSFEALPEGEDPVEAVMKAERPSAASHASAGVKRAAPPGLSVPAKGGKIAKTAPPQAKPQAKLLAKSPAKTPPQQPRDSSMPDAAPKQRDAMAAGRGSAEARAAASLLSGMRKKPS